MKSLLLLITFFQFYIVSFSLTKESHYPKYILDIKINPDSSFIRCYAEILNPSDSVFSLAKGIHIEKLFADNSPVDTRKAISFMSDGSIKLSFLSKPEKIGLSYSGKIEPTSFPKTISAISMVTRHLVELSDQIKWYPVQQAGGLFEFVLKVNLPVEYVTIVNNNLYTKRNEKNRIISIWKSDNPVWNITMIAAPHMKEASLACNGTSIEIYYSKLPDTYIDSVKNDLVTAYHDLSKLYGSPGACNLIRLVYSPRAAGGYARAPMIIVSENFALEQRKTEVRLRKGPQT